MDDFREMWRELDGERKRRGWTRERLARAMNEHSATPCKIKTLHSQMRYGHRTSWDVVRAVVAALGLDEATWKQRWELAERGSGSGRRGRAELDPVSVIRLPPESAGTAGAPAAREVGQVGRLPAPRQLPAAPPSFVGRQSELRRVVDGLVLGGVQRTAAVVAIHGPPGVGKSALAIQAAHQIQHHFPDGTLYLDIHGSRSVRPAGDGDGDVVSSALRAFPMAPHVTPCGWIEAAAMLRGVLADRRGLIVLDNVIDVGQVRQLVPANSECGVIVTSRRMLATLGARQQVGLAALGRAESHTLLRELEHGSRLADLPRVAEDVVTVCGGLPIALRIAAARINSRPDRPIRRLAARLADEARCLDELRQEDLSVRGCFDSSYRLLEQESPAAGRAFPLLAVRTDDDVVLLAAARQIGLSPSEAEVVLDVLVEARLIDIAGPSAYRMHPLLRIYGRELARGRVVTGRPRARLSAASGVASQR